MLRVSALAAAIAALLAGAATARASSSTVFTLTGHGYGHGIGLSQYGALGYAQHGYTAHQIVAHYYPGTALGRLASPPTERVLLRSGPTQHVTLDGPGSVTSEPGGSPLPLAAGHYRIVAPTTAGAVRIWSVDGNRWATQALRAPVRLDSSAGPLQLDDAASNGFRGAHWHGSFRVLRQGTKLLLVDVVSLERYVAGVVPSEVPASWPDAALRAQAIAARSYAVATQRPAAAYDAYADTRSQVYGPVEHEAPTTDAAVAGTRGRVVVYHGVVASTFFSSSSGGRTSSMEASWGSATGQPYLVPVADPYDAAGGANPNHTWPARTFTPASLGRALGLAAPVRAVDLSLDSASRRVLAVDVRSGGTTTTLAAGTVFARLALRSTYFRIRSANLHAPSRIQAGSRLVLGGRVNPRRRHVRLAFRIGGERVWRAGPRLATAPDGSFSVTLRPRSSRVYRFAHDVGSPQIAVTVAPRISLSASGGAFAASMSPPLAGASASLEARAAHGRWSVVERAAASARGRIRYATAPAAGTWRASFAGDPAHGAAASSSFAIAPAGRSHR